MSSNYLNTDLSLNDTNALKGIALLLLLSHHLFYHANVGYNDICIGDNHYLFNMIAMQCKLCVAIFVFLSGYGLAKQADKSGIPSLRKFYQRRYVKLLMNYWMIWLIFVPIGILFFDRTLVSVYGYEHLQIKFLIDLLGLSNAFGFFGYNATWWFYSVIIVLYSIFPLLYRYKQYWVLQLIIGAIIYYVFPYRGIGMYLIHFCVGMAMAGGKIIPPPHWAQMFGVKALS